MESSILKWYVDLFRSWTGADWLQNLGLGVLKEKRDGDDSSEADSDDESPYANAGLNKETSGQGESDVLGKLMGGKKSEKSEANKPSIEEVAE